jgi:hypothetical protein
MIVRMRAHISLCHNYEPASSESCVLLQRAAVSGVASGRAATATGAFQLRLYGLLATLPRDSCAQALHFLLQAAGGDRWRHSGGRKAATFFPAENIGPPRYLACESMHGSVPKHECYVFIAIGCGGSTVQSARGTTRNRPLPGSWSTLWWHPTV